MVSNAARRSAFAAISVSEASASIEQAARACADALLAGGAILACGNGGSAATAQHFAAEFTGKLFLDRRPLPAFALHVDTSALTAIGNDYGFDHIYSRQVRALGKANDVVFGFSTSGRSRNVVAAIAEAKEMGLVTVGVTGADNALGADISITLPIRETARVQEAHDLVLHAIAQIVERIVVPELGDDASADRFPFALSEADLPAYRAWLRESGQTLATTNGVFDLLHEGHRNSLRAARTFGDHLLVLVNSDDSVKRLKGPSRPIQSVEDRISALKSLHCVDHVVVMTDDNPISLLAVAQPDVHCKGADYEGRELPEAATVHAGGGRVEFLRLVDGYSTSAQVKAAQSGVDK